jgi:glycosyltransferase involved in cell wall biosynthesis
MPPKLTAKGEIAIAYISLVVPDTSEFRNPGMHPNLNSFMWNVLLGLKSDASAEVESFSAEPMPSFPRGKRLLVRSRGILLSDGVSTSTVTFLNLTPLKQLHIGLSILLRLIGWNIRTRANQHRAVFSFNLSVPHLVFTAAAARLTGTKLLVWISDLNVPGQTVPANILYRIDAWMARKLLKYVDGAIVVSDAIARDYLPGRSWIRMDGGVSCQAIEETGRLLETRRRDEGHFVIVATGTLDVFNGIQEILAAFSRLEGLHYRLIMAGRGPLQAAVEAAAKNDPRIDFRGFVDQTDLLALHARADVLVGMRITRKLNTAYAFPSKTFEYLLSGVPVVTTATGHMKEEYGPYSFLLDEDTPEALTTMLCQVESLGRPERERIGREARHFIIENKSWEVRHRQIAEYVHSRLIPST